MALADIGKRCGDVRLFSDRVREFDDPSCPPIAASPGGPTAGDYIRSCNSSSLYEIPVWGLVSTGRMAAAIELADSASAGTLYAAPQWCVIEMITIAQVRLRADDRQAAVEGLSAAVREATAQRLPH
jgi:hypothetical protein